MGTEKRERQKANRAARLEAERKALEKDETKQKFRSWGILAAILLVVIGIAAFCQAQGNDDNGDDDGVTSTDDSDEDGTEDDEAGAPAVIAGTTECPATDGTAERTIDFEDTFMDCLTDGASYQAVFTTDRGEVKVDLDVDDTPNTTNNFISLARYGYYEDTELFRTDNSIDIIQGGAPHTQDNSDPGPGYTIPDEGDFSADGSTGPYSYVPGQLVMARTAAPNSSSSQFFFTVGEDASNLDSQGTYLLFGEVTEGLDVLEEILALEEDGSGAPSETVLLETVEIIES